VFALIGIAVAPSMLFAAEAGAPENQGTWLGLMFFAINFALFVGILIYFAAPMARTYFRDRAAEIRSQIDRLNSAFKEAQELANRASAKIDHLESELAGVKTEMEAETAFQLNKIREDARLTAQRIRRDTELTGAAIIEAAQRRVRERLAATATRLARDLIASSIGASDQTRLIDSFMEEIRQEAPR
jgi:F0F1-type ATP synthase membrane subunit b/b'